MRKDTLGSQLLDLLTPVLVPVFDVGIFPDSERSAGVDESGHSILVASAKDEFLVQLGGTGLNGSDETGSDP